MGKENGSGPAVVLISPKTDEKIKTFNEALLKYNPEDIPEHISGEIKPVPCIQDSGFNEAFEKLLKSNNFPASGEIATAISEEQITITNYYRAQSDQNNLSTLLCTAIDTWDTYLNLNTCLSMLLAQESTSLQKLVSELDKSMETTGKEFVGIADKNKKAYDTAIEVKNAVKILEDCFKKVCTEKDKQAEAQKEWDNSNISKLAEDLACQAEQGYVAVTQAAAVFALSDAAGYLAITDYLKPQAEQFKKETDGNMDFGAKKIIETQKKFTEATTLLINAKANIGKLGNKRVALEKLYCTVEQPPVKDVAHQDELNSYFENSKNPTTPNHKTLKKIKS